MATKKAAIKTGRSGGSNSTKAGKASKSAGKSNSKAPAKKTVPAKPAAKAKPVAKKAAPAKKSAPKKPVATKPAPAKKAAPAKKTAPQKTAPAKKAAVPVKKPVIAAKKPEVKHVPGKVALVEKKQAAVAKPEPVKQEPVKTAEKPVAKPALKKEGPPKPVVIPKTSTNKSVKYEPEFTKSVLDRQKQAKQGPTMRYSDNELIEFRDLINKKLDTAKKELTYLQGLITRKDESGDLDEGRYMTMEDGSMSMEREQLSQMASRQIQFIDHLEKAVMRIENKTYGICRVTGQLIDKARLRAVPHATLSIEAKQMMNK